MLLYLIRRQNLNILDIPLAEITRQYMQYIELMQVLQLELAGEYLLMAATLAEVKSRMLLPRMRQRGGGRRRRIPVPELVRRLQEYERFKRAAEGIDRMQRLERDTWMASADRSDRKVVRLAAAGRLAGNAAGLSRVSCRATTCSCIQPCAARTPVGAAAQGRCAVVVDRGRIRGFRAIISRPTRAAAR